jgi:hypothetical protein
MKKYLQLSGTISGSVFLGRYFLSSILAYLMGFGLGYHMKLENYGLVVFFAILMSLAIYFNLVSIFKRVKALFPNHLMEVMIFAVIGNLTAAFVQQPAIVAIVNLAFLILNLTLIFKNSDVEKHEG